MVSQNYKGFILRDTNRIVKETDVLLIEEHIIIFSF